MATNLVDAIDALLPQTQCTQCGYAGCRPYAEAIARGESEINRCPPGGKQGIERLAILLDRPVLRLDPECGEERLRLAALIREEWCIGCTLCIQACPTDAIVGAPKQLHTVLTAACTGCELCVPPCPVDCIELVPMAELAARGSPIAAQEAEVPVAARADLWRDLVARRNRRIARSAEERDARLAARIGAKLGALDRGLAPEEHERKRQAIEAALQRARARRTHGTAATRESG